MEHSALLRWRGSARMGSRQGEVSERLKEPASKAGSLGNRARRFKSYPLRHNFLFPLSPIGSVTCRRAVSVRNNLQGSPGIVLQWDCGNESFCRSGLESWANFGLRRRGWRADGSAPIENHFIMSRTSEAGILLCRFRDRKIRAQTEGVYGDSCHRRNWLHR